MSLKKKNIEQGSQHFYYGIAAVISLFLTFLFHRIINDIIGTDFGIVSKEEELDVFLIRLAVITPILITGLLFLKLYKKHGFWPLHFGFSLFSIGAFFIELIPYTPNYNGYTYYFGGLIGSIALGAYMIYRFRKNIEQQQTEPIVSKKEKSRRSSSSIKTIKETISSHICPSCGKEFLSKGWEAPEVKKFGNTSYITAHFCKQCQHDLVKKCKNCGSRNFVHLPYCSSCGINTFEGNRVLR